MDYVEKDKEYKSHIKSAILEIEKYTAGLDFDAFLKSNIVKSATIRQLEIIGEAAKRLSAEFILDYHEIEWNKVVGMRNKLIHDYFEVNWEIVWDTVKNNLPKLKAILER